MLNRFLTFAAAPLLFVSPAAAADFQGEFGGWEVYSTETGCAAVMEFEGPGATTLTLLRFAEGGVGTAISNRGWSAKKGENYEVAYAVNGGVYRGTAVGTSDYPHSGFVSKFGDEFLRDFAEGAGLQVYLAEKQIDDLSLAGTGKAVAALGRCLVGVRRKIAAAEAERQRYAHLPRDPFAPPAAPSGQPGVAEPLNAALWANSNDYPSAALREGREGKTFFKASVSAEGRATDCQITLSSGHADLDAATCANILRRARFKPIVDAEGSPAIGSFESSVNWDIPD